MITVGRFGYQRNGKVMKILIVLAILEIVLLMLAVKLMLLQAEKIQKIRNANASLKGRCTAQQNTIRELVDKINIDTFRFTVSDEVKAMVANEGICKGENAS